MLWFLQEVYWFGCVKFPHAPAVHGGLHAEPKSGSKKLRFAKRVMVDRDQIERTDFDLPVFQFEKQTFAREEDGCDCLASAQKSLRGENYCG
jgi:hypothetical protein